MLSFKLSIDKLDKREEDSKKVDLELSPVKFGDYMNLSSSSKLEVKLEGGLAGSEVKSAESCKERSESIHQVLDEPEKVILSENWDVSDVPPPPRQEILRMLTDLNGNIFECQGNQEKVLGTINIVGMNFFGLMADYNKRYFLAKNLITSKLLY